MRKVAKRQTKMGSDKAETERARRDTRTAGAMGARERQARLRISQSARWKRGDTTHDRDERPDSGEPLTERWRGGRDGTRRKGVTTRHET